MGRAVFPPCWLTWRQTIVEAMKIMASSFQRFCACTAALGASHPEAGHRWPTPLPETPGHSRACLGQSLVGSQLLSSGSWYTQGFVCALQESVTLVLCNFWWFSGGSRATWSNRQIWPWSIKQSRAKANRALPKEHTGHSKHRLPTTQEKTLHMDITRWSIPKSDWLYSLQQRWRSSVQSAKTRLGADCGSDHELLTAKFRLKLKKVGKTTVPFRYDLNKIPYDYTVEVTKRFKGLDLIDKVPKELRMEFLALYRRQWSKLSPRKRNTKRQNGCLRRPYK